MDIGQTSRSILFYSYLRLLQQKKNSVTDLAAILETTKPNVSQQIKQLSDIGYLDHKPYQPITFSNSGLIRADRLYKRVLTLESFLFKSLAMPFYQCRSEAFAWEANINESTMSSISEKMGITIGLVGELFPVELAKLPTNTVFTTLKPITEGEQFTVCSFMNLGNIDFMFIPELSDIYLESATLLSRSEETQSTAILVQGKKRILPESIIKQFIVKRDQ